MNHKLEANMLRSRKRHKESMHVNTVELRGAPGHMHATAVDRSTHVVKPVRVEKRDI